MTNRSRLRDALMKGLGWLFVLAIVATAVVVVDEASKPAGDERAQAVPIERPKVTVVHVPPSDHPTRLTVLARLGPKYRSAISSIVEGRVSSLGERFVVGADIEKDEVLAIIDSSAYEARRAEAAQELSQARANLSIERRDAEQAQEEWRLLGERRRTAPSPLYLREPQLEAARLAVEAARRNLEHVVELVSAATVRAPFAATVVARNISPGEFVSVGQAIAELISNDEFEIAAQLTERQWELLDTKRTSEAVTVTDVDGDVRWSARVRSLGRLFDERTQLRSVHLTLEESASAPSPVGGQFVKVNMPGRLLEDVLVLPESAYTRDSAIWTIDEEDRLRKLPVVLLASEEKRVILERPLPTRDVYRVVLHPQSRFTVGMRVAPIRHRSELSEARS